MDSDATVLILVAVGRLPVVDVVSGKDGSLALDTRDTNLGRLRIEGDGDGAVDTLATHVFGRDDPVAISRIPVLIVLDDLELGLLSSSHGDELGSPLVETGLFVELHLVLGRIPVVARQVCGTGDGVDRMLLQLVSVVSINQLLDGITLSYDGSIAISQSGNQGGKGSLHIGILDVLGLHLSDKLLSSIDEGLLGSLDAGDDVLDLATGQGCLSIGDSSVQGFVVECVGIGINLADSILCSGQSHFDECIDGSNHRIQVSSHCGQHSLLHGSDGRFDLAVAILLGELLSVREQLRSFRQGSRHDSI